MPLEHRHDINGYFYRFGDHGHKYYYYDARTHKIAKQKALRQGRAIEVTKARRTRIRKNIVKIYKKQIN